MIQTQCKNCIFAKYENDTQVDCSIGRHKKLGISEVKENNFVLKRFCNTYRPPEWYNRLGLENSLKPEETVLEEVFPRIGFFIKIKTDSKDAIKDLKITLQSISNIEHMRGYVVVINDKVEYNEEIWGSFIEIFGESSEIKYHIVQIAKDINLDLEIIDESFKHAQNGWIMTISSGNIVDKDTLNKLHKIINFDMMQLTMVDSGEEFDNYIFPAYLFKFLNGNKPKLFVDESTDVRPFLVKMKTAQQRSVNNHIITKEEFDAA
jgi:hypothetical protein